MQFWHKGSPLRGQPMEIPYNFPKHFIFLTTASSAWLVSWVDVYGDKTFASNSPNDPHTVCEKEKKLLEIYPKNLERISKICESAAFSL